MAEVADAIRQFLETQVRIHHHGRLTDHTPLLDGVVDSLQVMRIISFVEEQFGVRLDIADVTVEHFSTVADIERLVASKKT